MQTLGRTVSAGAEHPEYLASQLRAALGNRGRLEAHNRLAEALARLAEAVPEPRTLAELEHELARLEQSYD